MSSSFRYPPRLLHGVHEPQWLPKSAAIKGESSLDTLDRQEKDYQQKLKESVLPSTSQARIGIAGLPSEKQEQLLSAAPDRSHIDVTQEVGFTKSFWIKYSPQEVSAAEKQKDDNTDDVIMENDDEEEQQQAAQDTHNPPPPRFLSFTPHKQQQQQQRRQSRMSTGSAMSLNTSRGSEFSTTTSSGSKTMLSPPQLYPLDSPTSRTG